MNESTPSFFLNRRHAAVIKHGLLRRYLPVFAGKTGSTAREGRVAFIDGFVGTGVYTDGSPGSPLLAATTAADLSKVGRQLVCYYVESEREQYEQLCEVLKNSPAHQYNAFRGTAAQTIPGIVREIGNAPLLAFLDPFGLVGMPFDLLIRILNREAAPGIRVGAPTEVLLNFSLTALRRIGGLVREQPKTSTRAKTRATTLQRLNQSLGGDWWQELMRTPGRTAEIAVIDGYVERVRAQAGGALFVRAGVPPRFGKLPIYLLFLFTRHPDGVWYFIESLSLAREHVMKEQPSWLDNPEDAVRQIRENIRRCLDEQPSVRVLSELRAIYGSTLGYARATHLRKAIKQLHAEGLTLHDGRGELRTAVLRRRGQ